MEFYIKYDMINEKSKNSEFVGNILQNENSDEIKKAFRDILNFEGEIDNLISTSEIILHFLNL